MRTRSGRLRIGPRIAMPGRCIVVLLLVLFSMAKAQQRFAMQPQDQTAVVGSRVTLPCRVIGKSGSLQWTKDDFGLGTHRNLSGFDRYSMIGSDEEGDYSLDIYPVMLEDDARYQCQVSPGDKGDPPIRSSFAQLTILVPPEPPRIVQGDRLVTTEDREIELECISYGGKPAAEITWIDGFGSVLTDGIEYLIEELPDGRRYTAKSVLKMTPKKEHHNTTFTCQAQNTAERTHRSARLKLEVKYAPKVTLTVLSGTSGNGRISEGAEVRMGCKADANPADVKYKWYINDEMVIGDYTTEMVIRNISRKHHDVIVKCEVHNPVGKSEESETLDISYGPYFRTRPQSVQADYGAAVTLTCDVDGNPLPDITWIHEDTDRVVGTNPNLTLRLDGNTEGRYYCKASVMGFQEIGAEAVVYMKGPPKIVSHRTQFGIEGDNVRVECTAFSIPLPERVTWMYNGREIDLSNQDYSVLEDPLPEGIKSTLIIRDSQDHHFGSYNCSVYNTYGSDTVEIALMPQKNFPLLIIVIGVVSVVIILVIIVMLIFLCCQKTKKKEPIGDANAIEKQCKESDRSSNISDIKLDLNRAGSSVSNVHCDLDYMAGGGSETGSESVITRIGVPLAGPVNITGQDIYRYSAEYTEPSFPPKSDGHNNNGYVPYVDYSRDYNPPPLMQTSLQSPLDLQQQSTRLQQFNSLQLHQSAPAVSAGPAPGALPLNDLTNLHLGPAIPNGGVDPRFSAVYGNPFLRNNNSVGLPAPNTAVPTATPAPPPYTRDPSRSLAMSTAPAATTMTVAAAGPNGIVPQIVRLPTSPTTQYIVSNANVTSIKRGTLATHV